MLDDSREVLSGLLVSAMNKIFPSQANDPLSIVELFMGFIIVLYGMLSLVVICLFVIFDLNFRVKE